MGGGGVEDKKYHHSLTLSTMAAIISGKSLKRANPDADGIGNVVAGFQDKASHMPASRKVKLESINLFVNVESAIFSTGANGPSLATYAYVASVKPLNGIPRVKTVTGEELDMIRVDPEGRFFDVLVYSQKVLRPGGKKLKNGWEMDDTFHKMDTPLRVLAQSKIFLYVNDNVDPEQNFTLQPATLMGFFYMKKPADSTSKYEFSWSAAKLVVHNDSPAASLSLTSRLKYLMPYAEQVLPTKVTIKEYATPQEVSLAQGSDALGKALKQKMPICRFEVADVGGRFLLPSEQYLLGDKRPNRGLSVRLAAPMVLTDTGVTDSGFPMFGSGSDMEKKFRAHVTIVKPGHTEIGAATAAEPVTETIMIEGRIFAHNLINAPVRVPTINQRLVEGTATRPPMVVTCLVKPDILHSYNDARAIKECPDGVIQVEFEKLFFEIRRHLTQYGIPLSPEAVKALFENGEKRGSPFGGDEMMPYVKPAFNKSAAEDNYVKKYVPMSFIDYTVPGNPDGVVALDFVTGLKTNASSWLWQTPGIKFYALPMTDEIALPTEADPAADPQKLLAAIGYPTPTRCTLRTPAEGDAFLLNALKTVGVFPPDAATMATACKEALHMYVVDEVDGERYDFKVDAKNPANNRYIIMPRFLTFAMMPTPVDGSIEAHAAFDDFVDLMDATTGGGGGGGLAKPAAPLPASDDPMDFEA
jgi:hypothetical protein